MSPDDQIALKTKAGDVVAAGPNVPTLLLIALLVAGTLWVVRTDNQNVIGAVEANNKVMTIRDQQMLDKLDTLVGVACAQLRATSKTGVINQKGCF